MGRGYVKVVWKRFRQGRWEDVSYGQIGRGQIIAGGESQGRRGEEKSRQVARGYAKALKALVLLSDFGIKC